MRRLLTAAASVALVGCASIPPANAADDSDKLVCRDRARFVQRAEQLYKEVPAAIGLQSNGTLLEVLAAPSGSFTILLTTVHGRAVCTEVVATGKAWNMKLPRAVPTAEKPA